MSRASWIRTGVMVPAGAVLWARSASIENGIGQVLGYVVAGTLVGLALTWIARAFASVEFNSRTAVFGAAFGVLIFTPVMAMLLDDNIDASGSSIIVLAISAAAAAAMAGALWGILNLAGEALSEWRHERSGFSHLTLGGAHR